MFVSFGLFRPLSTPFLIFYILSIRCLHCSTQSIDIQNSEVERPKAGCMNGKWKTEIYRDRMFTRHILKTDFFFFFFSFQIEILKQMLCEWNNGRLSSYMNYTMIQWSSEARNKAAPFSFLFHYFFFPVRMVCINIKFYFNFHFHLSTSLISFAF